MYMIAKEVAKLNLAFCVLQEVRHRNTGNKIQEKNFSFIGVAKRNDGTLVLGYLLKLTQKFIPVNQILIHLG